MTVALAGRAPTTFEIKSATLPLVALLLKSADLGRLGQELRDRFGDMPEFFDHDPLVIDLGGLDPADDTPIDFTRLLDLLRSHRVVPVGVKGGTEAQVQAARAAGLAVANDLDTRALAPSPAQGEPSEQPDPAEQQPAPVEILVPTTALVIDKPVRSGQKIYARGRDLVVLSMVNAGAEVIADGHIHVYAPLRGKAMAGARGDTGARILTLGFEPELVSIAGVYRTSEIPFPASVHGQPAQVRLQGDGATGKLLVHALHS